MADRLKPRGSDGPGFRGFGPPTGASGPIRHDVAGATGPGFRGFGAPTGTRGPIRHAAPGPDPQQKAIRNAGNNAAAFAGRAHAGGIARRAGNAARTAYHATAIGTAAAAAGGAAYAAGRALSDKQREQRRAAAKARWERHRSGGGLQKRWDGTKHPREYDGRFARKTGETVGRVALGAAGAVGGFVLGAKFGPRVGAQIGRGVGRLQGHATTMGQGAVARALNIEASEMAGKVLGRQLGGRFGGVAGATALGLGGYVAGSAGGAQIDEVIRRRRAKAAGKLDQYKRLNEKVSPTRMTAKQAKAAAATALKAGTRVQTLYDKFRGS